MDFSQSPTQSNDGRSYDQYANDDTPDRGSDSPGHRTLHDNDTGAVRFEFGKDPDTQLDEGASFDQFEPVDSQPLTDWPPKTQVVEAGDGPGTSFSHHQDATGIAPETPAVVQGHNPFGGQANGSIMRPSQLFGQTQMTSVVKAASPTSSRPSPNIFNHNTISPNHAISSPLKDRGLRTSPTSHGAISSPPYLRPSSRAYELGTSQDDYQGLQDHERRVSPEPRPVPPKRNRLDPIEEYRSVSNFEMAKPGQNQSSDNEGSDSDSDLADAARQRRARLKRSKAEKSLQAITLPGVRNQALSRSSPKEHKSSNRSAQDAEDENVEVPSTNRAKSKNNLKLQERSPTLGHFASDQPGHESDSQETVADSQHLQGPSHTSSAAAQSAIDQPSSPPPRPLDLVSTQRETAAAADTIPETSPPGTAAAEYAKHRLGTKLPFPGSNSSVPSLPPLPSTEPPPSTAASGIEGQIRREAESARHVVISSPMPPGLRSSPTVILASSQRMVTRSSRRLEQINSPQTADLPPSSDASSRTSSLSSLSATPPRPSSATPNTEHEVHEPTDNVSSPAVAKVQRRGRPSSSAPRRNVKSYSFSPGSTTRASSRASRGSSTEVSTKSPARQRRKEVQTRVAANARKSLRQTSTAQLSLQESNASLAVAKDGIFHGMTFAVTFQSKQRHEDDDRFKARVSQNKALKDSIVREGGVVLSDGFDALFRLESFHSRSSSSTKAATSGSISLMTPEMGFTALIADEHSRKAKYIQALALGLPCLAPRWVTTCVAKKKLVDWSSYLLCAGQSSFLGDAIRSRNLPYYDPTTSKFSAVIEQRPKLLENTEVLVVLKRTTKEDNMPYLFLVQVLGATLTRVYTLDEARTLLLQRQAAGEPFDWVYVGDRLSDVDTILYGKPADAKEQVSGARKRKRPAKASGSNSVSTSMAQGTAEHFDDGGRPPKRVRTLNDELVVQSLILGRLIEEDEMPL
ncbi:uncharacterized protein B0I36DRAFT_321523 [Microdochium trichocladiopsis]|uniref:BRCT domain-containing protein n=1 Tax=Microdochium trichocladiopsis TaxID=1682393 RepID=A0A9P8YA38_9PEZI|nr:uncharacterized protein B0I36DRAFT_321523 [Microdochium trichocladiopsis]KAH7033471.1 hypothetical protein B0I36DRAFT_321523 [Microdochium trichocladiopsis]